MAPIDFAKQEALALRLHPIHGAAGAALRPLRTRRDGCSARSLAETVASRAPPSELGAECRVLGPTLHISSAGGDMPVQLALAEVAASAIEGSDLAAVCVARAEATLAAACPERWGGKAVVGWVLVCRCSEQNQLLETLWAAGCLRGGVGGRFSVSASDVLGHGTFATTSRILRATSPDGSSAFAAKRVSGGDGLCRASVQNEVACLVSLQPHPNIVGFHGVFVSDADMDGKEPSLDLILDYAAGGDLARRGALPESRAASVVGDLLSALARVHERRIVHRDVKPDNVLLLADGRAVLADFGVAARRLCDNDRLTLKVGSIGYAAPEVLMGRAYGQAVDLFGAGAVLHFAIAGEGPFDSDDKCETARRTCEGEVDFFTKPLMRVGEDGRDLLRRLLSPRPADRPQAEQAKATAHRWLTASAAKAKAVGASEEDAIHSISAIFQESGAQKVCVLRRLTKLLQAALGPLGDV